jgi:ParB family chromosome partitioning protein
LESDISAALGLKVRIDHKGEAGGQISISYKSLEDLDDICQMLSQ